MSRLQHPGCFVTGTDTEVGKSHVSAALLHLLGTLGWRSAGYKPVAAGAVWQDGQLVNDDVLLLQQASSVALTLGEVCSSVYETACAPHLAAQQEQRPIDRARLLQGAHALARRADVLVIEGVGGFCVPLGGSGAHDFDSADLAQDFGLPVLLVVGLRLGCLNHALLTAEAVRARGLRLAGWVANSLQPHWPQQRANVDTLHQRLGTRFGLPCLGELPWLADPTPAALAQHLDAAAVCRLMGLPARPEPTVPL
jgi:dethiobiotin synthetase